MKKSLKVPKTMMMKAQWPLYLVMKMMKMKINQMKKTVFLMKKQMDQQAQRDFINMMEENNQKATKKGLKNE